MHDDDVCRRRKIGRDRGSKCFADRGLIQRQAVVRMPLVIARIELALV